MTPASRLTAPRATLVFVALTLALTWPLAGSLARDIPWDLGDSILNAYVLQWGGDHLLALAQGDWGALRGYWSPPIFHPETGVLAYSEHLIPQTLLALPVYAATRNVILSYNLVFLSTFVLSALGAFLLAREWTGSPRAALVAGVAFAFAPYRIGQYSHVQVLSAQWMPFALWALAVYFRTRQRRALVGGAAALWLNNLSCGYFLFYFPPFVALYAVWEILRRRLWSDRRAWLDLLATGALALVLTMPFVWPYATARAAGFDARPVSEVARFSADTQAYATAHRVNRVWGSVAQAFPRAEGELFPGLTVAVLACLALAALVFTIVRARYAVATPRSGWLRAGVVFAGAVALLHAALLKGMVWTGPISSRLLGVPLRVTSAGRTLAILVVAVAVTAWLSPRVRDGLRRAFESPLVFAVAAVMLAWAFSLGPRPTAGGRAIADWGPYAWLMSVVPGVDGLRVPARFAMVGSLFTAASAAFGVRALESRVRPASLVALAATILIACESLVVPLQLNGTSPLRGVVTPEGPLAIGDRTPPVYRAIAALPANAVIAEFPFGVEDYDLRYMLASAAHRRPLLNGYSGWFPSSYIEARAVLGDLASNPDRAWSLLRARGVTHVIVHDGAFLGDEGGRVVAALRDRGATVVGAYGPDRLMALPR